MSKESMVIVDPSTSMVGMTLYSLSAVVSNSSNFCVFFIFAENYTRVKLTVIKTSFY